MTTKVVFHDRASLGLGQPVPARLALRTPAEVAPSHEGFTWHHVGDGGTLFHPDPAARLRGIWAYHVNTRGYGDIAYHGAFDADGNTYGLRAHEYVGAHALSTDNVANRVTDGVVFLEDARGITEGAVAAFEWWGGLYEHVIGHVPQSWAHEAWAHGAGGTVTACPGADWVAALRFLHGHV